MPKKNAQEVLEEIIDSQSFDEVADKINAYIVGGADPANKEDTEIQGIGKVFDRLIRKGDNDTLKPESLDRITRLHNSLVVYGDKLKLQAGEKVDQIKDRIRRGEVPGTEFFLAEDDEKINNLANNIFVAENPELVKKMKSSAAATELYRKHLENYKFIGEMEKADENNNSRKENVNIPLIEYLQAKTDEFVNKKFVNDEQFRKHAAKREEYFGVKTEIENKNGFEINPEYKPDVQGAELFSKQPEEISEFMACSTKEDYEEQKEAAEFKKDACDKYIDNTNVLAKNAKAMLEELDAIQRTDGKENSVEYDNMRKALEAVSKLGKPMQLENDQEQMPKFVPAEINAAIDELTAATEAYQKKNDAIYKKNDFGRERLNMSKRLHNLAEIAKPVMDPKKYGLGEFIALDEIKAEQDKRIERLEAARVKKGFDEFKPHKKKELTVNEKLIKAKEHGEAAKNNVMGGSSEYDKAIRSYDKLVEAYEIFSLVKADPEMDNNVRRAMLEKADKAIASSKADLNKYITRKNNKGQIQKGSTVDLKSQKRINAVNEGLGIVKTIEKEISEYKESLIIAEEAAEAEEVVKLDADNAEITKINNSHIQNEIKTLRQAHAAEEEGSFMKLSAKYAMKGYSKLFKLMNDAAGRQLTAAEKSTALGAMATVTYYSMLCGLDKQQVNQANQPDKRVLEHQLIEFLEKPEFTRVLGDGSEITREQITDFLADPTMVKDKIIANREKVREINANVDAQQQRQQNQPQVELDNNRGALNMN